MAVMCPRKPSDVFPKPIAVQPSVVVVNHAFLRRVERELCGTRSRSKSVVVKAHGGHGEWKTQSSSSRKLVVHQPPNLAHTVRTPALIHSSAIGPYRRCS